MTAAKVSSAVALFFCIAGCASTHDSDQAKLSAQTYYAAGQLAEAQHSWARAINEYQHALAAQGTHAPSLYRLGIIYTQLKDYPHAIEAWEQYIDATYGAALAYGDLAYTCEQAGRYAEAKQAYESALKKEPANPTCRVNYGRMLARQGNIPAAEDQLRGILPEPQVHYQIGIICQQQKDYSQARAQFTQAATLDPQLLDAKARLAEIDSPTASK